jgi:hypothetical protein
MGAGTSADPGAGTGDAAPSRRGAEPNAPVTNAPVANAVVTNASVAESPVAETPAPAADATGHDGGAGSGDADETATEKGPEKGPEAGATGSGDSVNLDGALPGSPADAARADPETEAADQEDRGRRFTLTRDTARPEGGGRAAPRAAPAPARQWPLLSVLGTTGLGLLIVGLHPFAEAFRIGTILIGVALIGGAVLRRALPSVGMLAVRSRFTDMLTYGLLGVAIVLLSLMTQPRPWLEIPFLEDTLHFTVR